MAKDWKNTLVQGCFWLTVLIILVVSWHYNTTQTLELRRLCIEKKGSWTGDSCVFVEKAGAQ